MTKDVLRILIMMIAFISSVNADDKAWINIDSTPQNVDISINKNYIGKTPIRQLEVEPGNYTLTASKDNFISKVIRFTTPPLLVKNVKVLLHKQTTPRNGWVNIKSAPDKVNILIKVDENQYINETTPVNQLELKPGNYVLTASKDYYNTKSIAFTVKPSMVENVNIILIKGGGWELLNSVKSANINSGFGKLTVLTKERYEAEVFLDSELIPQKTPLTFTKIPAGEHIIELRYKDIKVKKKVIIEANDETQLLSVSLTLPLVNILTTPLNANVIIKNEDNIINSFLSPASVNLESGRYSLEISKKFFKPINKIIDVKTDSINLELTLEEDNSHTQNRLDMINRFILIKDIYDQKKEQIKREIALLNKNIQNDYSHMYYQKTCTPGIFSIIAAPFSALVFFFSDNKIKNPDHIKYLKRIGNTVYNSNLFNNNQYGQLSDFGKTYNPLIGISKYHLVIEDHEHNNLSIKKRINELESKLGLSEMEHSIVSLISQICQNLEEVGKSCGKKEFTNFTFYKDYFSRFIQ